MSWGIKNRKQKSVRGNFTFYFNLIYVTFVLKPSELTGNEDSAYLV